MKTLSPQSIGEIRMTDKERGKRKELSRAPRPRIASTIVLTHGFSPRKARAVALASVRETYEETSLLLGTLAKTVRNHRDPSWDAFRKAGLKPSLDGIEVFGRAVTPPHRHKRFDAWFFLKHLETPDLPEIADSAELLNVGWFTFEEIWQLELQRATQMMLKVLQQYMTYDRPPHHIFYSHAKHGKFITDSFPPKT